MKRWSRRTFLAAGAAAVASPLPVLAQGQGDTDVVIVGAGAAGIAAARRVMAAGRRCTVLEASDRVGGRCFTDGQTFGVPYDQGAHAFRMPDGQMAKLGRAAGFEIRTPPAGYKMRVGRRFARENEMEIYLSTLVRARRAIEDSVDEDSDPPASRALPKDTGEWRPTVEFMLGPFGCGKNLEEISTQDFSRAGQRDGEAYCRQGFGAVVSKLAEGIPVRLSTPVTRIATWRGITSVETPKGTVTGRAVIVTASTNVLSKIRFDPALPKSHLEAAAKLALGTYERIALELDGNPLGLGADELVIEKANDTRTAALLANVGGTSLSFVDVAGKFARSLSGSGDAAMRAFAIEWLAGLFGTEVKQAVRRTHVTHWAKDPWVLGAMSGAAPGAQGERRTLAEPVRDRVFFAGEATHETLWGTVGGAWEAGERAADAAIKRVGGARRQR
jgi:monoamine oxidase